MKRVFAFVVFFFAFLSAFCQERELIRRNLYVLASDSLQGRAAGASEGARAREYISKQLDDAGLDVYHQSFKVGEKTYTNVGKTGFANQNKGSDDRITSSSSMFKLTYYFNR